MPVAEDVPVQAGHHVLYSTVILVHSSQQAAACADAGATLISPFVGRIMDWYKAKEGRDFAPHEVRA